MTQTKILISGASVAGPALAYWLHRYGYRVTVVEKAPDLRGGGYAVDFRGDVHMTMLRRMGVLADIERLRTRMGATWYVNSAGKRLVKMPDDLFAGDVEILRGDLAQVLYQATRDDTEYIFGDSISSAEEDADGVTVHFERGDPRRFDLVIGADGVHSKVRSVAFGPEDRYVKHLGLHCAIFTAPNHLGLSYSGLAYSTPGKVVSVYSARDNTETKALFYFASPAADYHRHDVARQKKILAETFRGNGWETDPLLVTMWDSPDFYFDSVSQVHMDTWTRGRFALLGDAAWCPSSLSGMGTGLAMVGAYVLAGELATAEGDHRTAFAAYERELRAYVRGCQKQGEGVSRLMVPESPVLAWFLRLNFKLIPYLPWKGLMAKSVRKTASAYTLKPYTTPTRRP
ncbi:FAD-dependent monooxygenase [Spongiactinospora sp. TRM90649]|uniref:FAD-dependent monooxygenase n=1 Tax=Spongiactinospora sp. TRM90649 TaxID=3031114 RepID=UPI0023F62C45|nr:FAD-dependent monooxygenase [Spongiactinospora sp. TRM90649]MDF5758554.1 FAD-dependent monooxygenase [Spongiactinospora sp. TRM90649]